MAITEDRVEETATLADLLHRVEALETEQSKQVKKRNKMTIIAWGGQLDRIWPTTILATTAAASGMEASVFFTFWGLFAIVKPGVRITGDNWMQKMMSVMNPGSRSDVPSWAELTGNVLESAETLPDGSFRYLISKAV